MCFAGNTDLDLSSFLFSAITPADFLRRIAICPLRAYVQPAAYIHYLRFFSFLQKRFTTSTTICTTMFRATLSCRSGQSPWNQFRGRFQKAGIAGVAITQA